MFFLRSLFKFFVYTTLALVLVLGTFVLSLRYWLLPHIENYHANIVATASQMAGARVAIGSIRAQWVGLRPRLELDRVQVFDGQDNPALELDKVDAVLSWQTIFARALRLHTLEIIQPSLEVRRDKAGKLF